ncbi:MAG: histidine kinase dimerization/phosphoacceptor domain -containing protein [Thermodesulfobacteriota bacterium]
MKIVTKLQLAALLPVLTALVIGLTFFFSFKAMDEAREKGRTVQEIVNSAHELSNFALSYMRHHEERPRLQFLAVHDEVVRIFAAIRFRDNREQQLLVEINNNIAAMKETFLWLVASHERYNGSSANAALHMEAEERLAGRMLIESREAIANALRLEGLINDRLAAAQRRISTLVFLLIAVTTFPLAVILFRIMKNIKTSFAALRKGTAVIGAGNLNHRIGMAADDEIGELAGAFDRMTEQLRNTTVSRDALVEEVEERRRAEESLRASESRFRILFETMSEGFSIDEIICDEAGKPYDLRYLEVNPAFERHTGLKAGDILGRTTLEMFPDAEPLWFERLGRVALTGEPGHFQAQFGPLDRWFEVSAYQTEPGRFAIVFFDITDRRRAEEALRESRTKLRAALASMTDAVFIADAQGNFIEFNDAFATFHRFRNKDECSTSLAEYPDILEVFMADGELAPLDQWAVPRALRGETATNTEYTLRRRDTGEEWVGSYSFAPIRDKDGLIVGAVVVGRDITEQKAAEDRLKASLREKEVLLQEIHHRVKNNMQVISSLVSLQADEMEDDAMRAVLQDVTHRVRSMAMVHEKLYQSADLARIDFAAYARSLLDYLWRAYGPVAADVRLVADLEPVLLPVNTAVPCGLILNELVGNALKHAFSCDAGGEVNVSLRSGSQGRLELRVRDNGRGLPPDFDWRQARSLGLRLVQMLAGQLHAAVEAASGEGTEFVLTMNYNDE